MTTEPRPTVTELALAKVTGRIAHLRAELDKLTAERQQLIDKVRGADSPWATAAAEELRQRGYVVVEPDGAAAARQALDVAIGLGYSDDIPAILAGMIGYEPERHAGNCDGLCGVPGGCVDTSAGEVEP
jgi:hypothetical protein